MSLFLKLQNVENICQGCTWCWVFLDWPFALWSQEVWFPWLPQFSFPVCFSKLFSLNNYWFLIFFHFNYIINYSYFSLDQFTKIWIFPWVPDKEEAPATTSTWWDSETSEASASTTACPSSTHSAVRASTCTDAGRT